MSHSLFLQTFKGKIILRILFYGKDYRGRGDAVPDEKNSHIEASLCMGYGGAPLHMRLQNR